ncbi:hypothetical protein CPB85DRAFT_650849 [Mucidula mucida]|nr:hypothetical protein CPB85DRAFT_650849 [Mucidula mucida]
MRTSNSSPPLSRLKLYTRPPLHSSLCPWSKHATRAANLDFWVSLMTYSIRLKCPTGALVIPVNGLCYGKAPPLVGDIAIALTWFPSPQRYLLPLRPPHNTGIPDQYNSTPPIAISFFLPFQQTGCGIRKSEANELVTYPDPLCTPRKDLCAIQGHCVHVHNLARREVCPSYSDRTHRSF